MGSIGREIELSIQLKNSNRGFAWGRIESQGIMPGLIFPGSFNCLQDSCIKIYLNTLDKVQPGFYDGKLILHTEGLKNDCEIQVSYEIEHTKVIISPNEIHLGLLSASLSTSRVTVDWESGVRLKGKVEKSDSLSQIKINPTGKFDYSKQSSFQIVLTIDPTSLEANWYKGHINLQANGKNHRIPVTFNTPIQWNIIFKLSIVGGLMTGAITLFIRYAFISITKIDTHLLHIPLNFLDLTSINSQFFSGLGLFVIGVPLLVFAQNIDKWVSNVGFSSMTVLVSLLPSAFSIVYSFLIYVPRIILRSIRSISLSEHLGAVLVLMLILGIYAMSIITIVIYLGGWLMWSMPLIVINGVLYLPSFLALTIFTIVDLAIYPLHYVWIDPMVGWFLIGFLAGGGIGLIKALEKIKQRSWLSKIYIVLCGIPLVFLFVGYLMARGNGLIG
jgi:hypothetical protein